jgi:alpha-acetolactate decarboxylase
MSPLKGLIRADTNHAGVFAARFVQVVFEYTQQEGLLVGFWCPSFVGSSLNVPGFHFHYLSADKQRGGHVLEVQVQQGANAYLQEVRMQDACRLSHSSPLFGI